MNFISKIEFFCFVFMFCFVNIMSCVGCLLVVIGVMVLKNWLIIVIWNDEKKCWFLFVGLDVVCKIIVFKN